MKLLILYVILCLSLCFAQEESCHIIQKEKWDIYCQSPNYPENYKAGNCSCEFHVDDGYQIELTLEHLNLDSANKDNVLIQAVPDEKLYQFSWSLNKPIKYLIEQTTVLIQFQSFENNLNHSGFSVHLKRYGELPITVESTTVINWPEPVENDTIYYTVNLTKIKPNEFIARQNDFKLFLVNMSEAYCKKHKIALSEKINVANIKINKAVPCPIQWPDSHICIQIRYAIPIFLENSSKYELSAENLQKMWNEFARKNLASNEWYEYQPPDNSYSLMIWLIISGSVLLVFFMALFFFRSISFRLSNHVKRRASDTEHIITPRLSDSSLNPGSRQIVPPIFDNEVSYSYYEPDPIPASFRNSQLHSSASQNIINIDDSSDEDILTVTNNAARSNYSHNINILEANPHAEESVL